MIIRKTPLDINNYIVANSKMSQILHNNGFIPKYMDDTFVYYVKTKELLDFIENHIK